MPVQDLRRSGLAGLPARRLFAALLLTALLLTATFVAATASGQEPPPQPSAAKGPQAGAVFGETIEVGLVGLDVWVTDGEGRRVTGLTAEDFEVRRDGERVAIPYFSEVREGASRVGAPVAPPRSADPRDGQDPEAAVEPDAGSSASEASAGHLVVYVDQARLSPTSTRSFVAALDASLASGQVAAERILILRQERSLRLEMPFGSDEAEVRATLERILAGADQGLARANELRFARDEIVAAWEWAREVARSERGACDRFRPRAEMIVRRWTRERASGVARSLDNLDAAAGLLAGLPGAKSLIYVSDGLDLAPGASLAGLAADLCPGYGGGWEMGALADGLQTQFLHLASHLNAHGVTLHALQASGLRRDRSGSASERASQVPLGVEARFDSRQIQAERSGMGLLAQQTGGREIYNQGDLGPALADIGEDLDHYYSLAVAVPEGSGPVHRMEVALADGVGRGGWRLRYRRTVRPPEAGERLEEGLAGALHLGIVRNVHGLSLGVVEAPSGDGPPLLLTVSVPLDRLVFTPPGDDEDPSSGEEWARVDLRALALGSGEGAPRRPLELGEEFRLRRPAAAAAGGESATLPVPLALPPGPYRLAVALHDRASGEASFVVTVLSVPGEAASASPTEAPAERDAAPPTGR